MADARGLGIARVHERQRLCAITGNKHRIAPCVLPPRNEDQPDLRSEMHCESIEEILRGDSPSAFEKKRVADPSILRRQIDTTGSRSKHGRSIEWAMVEKTTEELPISEECWIGAT